MTALGALASLTPDAVAGAASLVRLGLVIDLSIPLDADVLPQGDPAFNEPFHRWDVMTPEQWHERVGSEKDAFHLDAIGGSIHQGTHIDGLVHVVNDGKVFDGIPAGAFSWPGLTTIEKPGRQIGIRAVECLIDQIAGGRQRERIYLPCRLVERGSLADVSASAPVRVAAGR